MTHSLLISNSLIGSLLGQTMALIGSAGVNDTVFCTSDKTYSIKKVETSNTVYIVPKSTSNEYKVSAQCKEYYELKMIPAKISRVSELLKNTEYNGIEHEASIDTNLLLTPQELREQIQASDIEYANAIKSLGVVKLNDKMRIINSVVIRELIRYVCDTIMENSWDINHLSFHQLYSKMNEVNESLLLHTLSLVGEKKNSSSDDNQAFWVLNRSLLATQTARYIFETEDCPNGKYWVLDDFMSLLAMKTPGSGSFPDDILDGIASVDNKKQLKYLR